MSAETATRSILQYLDNMIDYVNPLTLADKATRAPLRKHIMFNATNVDSEGLMQMIQTEISMLSAGNRKIQRNTED